MQTVNIEFNGSKVKVSAGLIKASDLYEKLGVSPDSKWLYLGRHKDIDIPLLPDDYIVIHGGEKIFEDDINHQIGENPSVRSPLQPMFNGKKLEEGCDKAKILGQELRQRDKELPSSKLFVDLSSQVDAFVADDWMLVIQDNDSYFTIPAGEDDAVDLEECAHNDRRPPKGNKYKIKIDGEKYKVEEQHVTGGAILALVAKKYSEWSLNQKLSSGRRKAIEEEETIDLASPGVERFETVKRQAQQG